jgi:hypothetical protein
LEPAWPCIILDRQAGGAIYDQITADPRIADVQIVPSPSVARFLFPGKARIRSQARTGWYALGRDISALVSCLLKTQILRCVILCYPDLRLDFYVCMEGL